MFTIKYPCIFFLATIKHPYISKDVKHIPFEK